MDELPLSDITQRLARPESDVWAVHDDAVQRISRGEEVILLTQGDPDFDTPPYISNYVIEQINKGRTHYSPAAGEPELRAAVAALETSNIGTLVTAEQVVIYPGATATLYAALACIANSGEGVIVADPMYVGYNGIATALGIELQTVALQQPQFTLELEQVWQRVTPSTRAVLVNTPGNPCGNLVDPERLRALAQGCRERNLWLLCDEVYSLITFEQPHVSLLKCVSDLSNVIVIDGLSKSHAMSGWRVGWTVSSETTAAMLARFSGAAFFGTSQFIQDAAAYALANDAEDVEVMRQAYQARRDYVVSRIKQIEGLDLVEPQGGMFVMIDVGQLTADGEAFSRGLLDTHSVAVLPGACFGPSASGYVRCSLTEDTTVLGDAMDRLAVYCDTLR